MEAEHKGEGWGGGDSAPGRASMTTQAHPTHCLAVIKLTVKINCHNKPSNDVSLQLETIRKKM